MAVITKELAVRANTPTINDHIYSEELLKSMAHTMVNKPIYMGVDNAISGDLHNIIATVIAANYTDGGVTLKIKTLRGVTYHKDIWNYADLTTYGEGEIAEDDRTIVSCRVINLFLRPRRFMKRPNSIKIFDVEYKILYVAKPSDVDIFKRDSLWGQIDFWTRTIRIYDTDRADSDILQTIWHELLHGICAKLKLDNLNKDETTVDLLATAINTILVDNVKGFSFK